MNQIHNGDPVHGITEQLGEVPTLRDQFAMAATKGGADAVCSQLEEGLEQGAMVEAARHARAAYMLADAMLRAREAK